VKVYSGLSGLVIQIHTGGVNEWLGMAVAGVGDVDHDGIPDVGAGSPLASPAGAASGRVTIWSGANGSVIQSFTGSVAGAQFGFSLAGIGDVDHDGYADLIVGSPHEFMAQADAGVIRVFSGKNGATLFTKSDYQLGGEYGTAVAGGMDVDGDGTPDFLVGVPMLDNGIQVDTGGMHVYSGATFQLLDSHYSNTPGEHFGASLAFLGDINNDGRADYVVGGPDYNAPGAPGAGRALVYSGIDGSQIYALAGGAGQRYGSAFAAGGDLDQNQFSDLIVGAPGADDSGPESGFVRLVSLFPKGVSLYGSGTPGCAGPVLSFTGSAPSVGNANFAFTESHVPPGVLSLGLVSSAFEASGNDPFGIGVIFLVNLVQASEVYTLDVASDASGHGYVKVAIPNNPSFVGKTYYYQAISYWGGICQVGPLGFSSSNGIAMTILP
jgi:hypothetical protein